MLFVVPIFSRLPAKAVTTNKKMVTYDNDSA